MKSKKQIVLPKFLKMFEQLGENIKLARKRRELTTIQVSERAGMDRTTLYHIENGSPSVSIGAYFNVLRVLNLHEDFLKLAADDELGRKLQDLKYGWLQCEPINRYNGAFGGIKSIGSCGKLGPGIKRT